MLDAMVWAKIHEFDVFNVVNDMDNPRVFDELRFGMGDGQLALYMQNCPKCSAVPSNEVAFLSAGG
jgi:glycylpeptide N-tetradecanoyltransferase